MISGVVVNTCGYIRQEGYESFKHVAKTFDGEFFLPTSFSFFTKRFDFLSVDIIIVLDSEWLATKLTSDLPSVKVLALPKSGGVSEQTNERMIDDVTMFFSVQVVSKDTVKEKFRENKIREYFYGPKNNINPHVFTVEFHDIKIFKIGAPQIPDNCLPAGVVLKNQYNKIVSHCPE